MAKPPRQEEPPQEPDSKARAWSLLWALLLVAVALIAAGTGRLRLSGGSGRTVAVLSGGPLWLMLGALACAVLALSSVAVQGLHRNANPREYEAFRWCVLWLGGAFAASSLIAHLYLGVRG